MCLSVVRSCGGRLECEMQSVQFGQNMKIVSRMHNDWLRKNNRKNLIIVWNELQYTKNVFLMEC